MTGLERNGDIVFAASYAPLLQVCSKILWIYLNINSSSHAARQQHSMGTWRICLARI